MKPIPIEGLDYVRASHKSHYGLIKSEWVKTADVFDWQINIPANTTATIYLPVRDRPEILESGSVFEMEEGTTQGGIIEITLTSGSYHFISKLN